MNILNMKRPIWFMRQAGRHLPEYRKIRSKKKHFLVFCFDKKSIFEATLQPVRRYKIDCAIIFSDILIAPYILGQKVSFVKGEGPLLEKLSLEKLINLKPLSQKEKDLQNTYNAIKTDSINKKLPIHFIIEDNSKSVCTNTRKTWSLKNLTYEKTKSISAQNSITNPNE